MSFIATAVAVGTTLIGAKKSSDAADRAGKREARGKADEIEELRRQYDLTREDFAPFREINLSFADEFRNELLGKPSLSFDEKTRMGEVGDNIRDLDQQIIDLERNMRDYAATHSMKRSKDIAREQGSQRRLSDLKSDREQLGKEYFGIKMKEQQPSTWESKFKESPGYQFRMDEAQKMVDRVMSRQGQLNTPTQQKAMYRYAQGIASDEYNNYLRNLMIGAGMNSPAASSTASQTTPLSQGIARAHGDIGQSRANAAINSSNAYSNALNQLSTFAGYRYGQNNQAPSSTPPIVPYSTNLTIMD